MKDSVLCGNRKLNLQTGRIGIIQELRQTIQPETGLPVQQHIPFRTGEMGLEPESTMNTDHPEAVKTDCSHAVVPRSKDAVSQWVY